MNSSAIVGLNTKWYRYKSNLIQEKFAELTGFKTAYLSTIETGEANLTLKNIDLIAKILKISPKDLFDIKTAKSAQKLPRRIDMYKKKQNL